MYVVFPDIQWLTLTFFVINDIEKKVKLVLKFEFFIVEERFLRNIYSYLYPSSVR